MKVRHILKDVPNTVWVCLTVITLAVIGGFVGLTLAGVSTEDFSRFINTGVNLLTLILVGGGTAGIASAAVNSKRAADQTNGQLTETVKTAIAEAVKPNDDVPGE